MPNATLADRTLWAGMRAVAYGSSEYRLDVTLGLVARVRAMDLVPPVEIPTDAEIEAAFLAARQFQGAASIIDAP